MNLVEVWFGINERQVIHRGLFRSVRALTSNIRDVINGWNPRARPFVWTKTAEQKLAKADRGKTQEHRFVRFEDRYPTPARTVCPRPAQAGIESRRLKQLPAVLGIQS